jgi:hypothetical protein
MSEPLITESTDELQRLRNTNADLLKAKHTAKARIEELEADSTALQTKLTAAESAVQELTIGGPLKAMAVSISNAPTAFIDAFQKSYRVAMQDGKLALQTADGKPVMENGKAIPFEREALLKLLLASEEPVLELYKSILIVNKASGGAGRTPRSRSQSSAEDGKEKTLPIAFGLK